MSEIERALSVCIISGHRNQTDYNSIDTMSVLFLFICDIITTGNDVSLLEIENRKNKADDVYDLFCRRNQLFNFYDRREII